MDVSLVHHYVCVNVFVYVASEYHDGNTKIHECSINKNGLVFFLCNLKMSYTCAMIIGVIKPL